MDGSIRSMTDSWPNNLAEESFHKTMKSTHCTTQSCYSVMLAHSSAISAEPRNELRRLPGNGDGDTASGVDKAPIILYLVPWGNVWGVAAM